MTKSNTPSPVIPNTPKQPMNPTDVNNNKLVAIIAYLGLLCLVPLLLIKDSKFAQFHGKQGLVLLIFWVVVSAAGIVPVVGWIAAFFGYIIGIVLTLVGIINAARGEARGLPWIGHYADRLSI